MKKTIFSIVIVCVLVSTMMITVSAQGPDGNKGNQFKIVERIQSHIRDMLGICKGNITNLTSVTGVMEYDGLFFKINNTELHFGPRWYITLAVSSYDYDEDGVNETIFEELQGLVELGENVTVEGYLQSDNWLSVFYINGTLYREIGQPIWASQHQWNWRHRHCKK